MMLIILCERDRRWPALPVSAGVIPPDGQNIAPDLCTRKVIEIQCSGFGAKFMNYAQNHPTERPIRIRRSITGGLPFKRAETPLFTYRLGLCASERGTVISMSATAQLKRSCEFGRQSVIHMFDRELRLVCGAGIQAHLLTKARITNHLVQCLGQRSNVARFNK